MQQHLRPIFEPKMWVVCFALVAGVCLLQPLADAIPISLLKQGEHCVAYKAKKKLFLLATTEVIGKTCSVSAQVTPGLEDTYAVEVRLQHNTFESGEKKRDEDVSKLLGSNENSYVSFKSDMKSTADWNALLSKDKFEIPGTLNVNGRDYPVTADAARVMTADGYEIDGVIKTHFKDLNLEAPVMAGGLFAEVQDDLELNFHLRADRTLGASAILPKPVQAN